MEKTIGEKLSTVLEEIEDTLWEFEYNKPNNRPKYTMEGFRGSVKIFMSAILDKMWEKQEKDNIVQEEREKEAEDCGKKIREFVMKYTDIDTKELYKK